MPESIQGNNGSGALMSAARAMVWGFDLGSEAGFDLLWDEFNPRCVPPWEEADIRRRCESATEDAKNPRGWLLKEERGTIPGAGSRPELSAEDIEIARSAFASTTGTTGTPAALGSLSVNRDEPPHPLSDEGLKSAAHPTPDASSKPQRGQGVEINCPQWLAETFMWGFLTADGYRLRFTDDGWFVWENGLYKIVQDADVRSWINAAIMSEFATDHEKKIAWREKNPEQGDAKQKAKPILREKLTVSLASSVLNIVKGIARLSTITDPAWIEEPETRVTTLAAFPNGILDFDRYCQGDRSPTVFIPPTPRFFTRMTKDFDFDPNAPRPVRWLKFLNEVWVSDKQSIDCLQEWFGYLLTPDTGMQKMLLLLGEPNSGKSTILGALRKIVGEATTTKPEVQQLTSNFGLAPLLGKTLAVVDDARFTGQDAQIVLERLLSIIGQGRITVDRKNKEHSEDPLTARFVIATNKVPCLPDSSAALVRRVVAIRTETVFQGNASEELGKAIIAESPGILLWALEGLKRLRERNKFIQPESGNSDIETLRDLASPIRQFVEECCELIPDAYTGAHDLYQSWREFCKRCGFTNITTKQTFLADLDAALGSSIKKVRIRVSGKPRTDGKDNREYVRTGIRLMDEVGFN